MVKRAWLYKDLKVLDLQANFMLSQPGRHQTGMAQVSGSIPSGGNILLLIFFLFPCSKATDLIFEQ